MLFDFFKWLWTRIKGHNCGCHCQAVMETLKRQESILKEHTMQNEELKQMLQDTKNQIVNLAVGIKTLNDKVQALSTAELPQDIQDSVKELHDMAVAANASLPAPPTA